MHTPLRKSLVLAALLALATGSAAVANAQKTTDIATVNLSGGGKIKTAPDGTASVAGTITNNTAAPLTLCGLAFSIDPDTISFDDIDVNFDAMSQSFTVAPGQTVAFAPINLTVLSAFRCPFFLGSVGASLSTTGDCENDPQTPIAGAPFKIKMRD